MLHAASFAKKEKKGGRKIIIFLIKSGEDN